MTELTLLIRSQFSLRLSCYEMLWLYIDIADCKSFRRSFTVIIRRTLYHGISVYPYRIWLVVTCFCLFKKLKPLLAEQIPCHSSFFNGIICGSHRGSFAVRDHLRSILGIISGLGIICSRESFAALYSTTFYSKTEKRNKNLKP